VPTCKGKGRVPMHQVLIYTLGKNSKRPPIRIAHMSPRPQLVAAMCVVLTQPGRSL